MKCTIINHKFRTFDKLLRVEIEGQLLVKAILPFLKIGTTAACFQSEGNSCSDKLRLKTYLSTKYLYNPHSQNLGYHPVKTDVTL
jgi:hypothetical protein